MITIFIDNKPYQVMPDQNLLQACLSLDSTFPTSAGTPLCMPSALPPVRGQAVQG